MSRKSPEWVYAIDLQSKVISELGCSSRTDSPDCYYFVLSGAIMRGELRARDADGRELSAAQWSRKAVKHGNEPLPSLPLDNMEIHWLGVSKWIAENKLPVHSGRKRGPKASWDWEVYWLEICRIMYEDGLPKTRAELAKRLSQWGSDKFGSSPSISEVNKRMKWLYDEIAKSDI